MGRGDNIQSVDFPYLPLLLALSSSNPKEQKDRKENSLFA